MKVGIVQFPGSNCDWDAYHALESVGSSCKMLWHKDKNLKEAEALVLPGGFSYGDYLRCGALARCSPIMVSVVEFARRGGLVLGICNGFQILCEAELLPGCLIQNNCLEFRCHDQTLTVENSTEWFNEEKLSGHLQIPIAHGKGNYQVKGDTLDQLEANHQILLRYSGERGNPNGSMNQIAGIRNRAGNVFGIMPHPERAVETFHTSQDGIKIFKAFLSSKLL